ncbi:hypothetical protein C8A01DRAFT_50512 [Parachaetomium inaequale]|uniref:Uncharacterized protein n=1 Tax=Parachaetomium inaequale TaxID=2588326 RepID=A0AAN6P6P4_9PEZI|nr:hypothetical protein C8A01DRAFT_50512 [Parachaetomium inaequale]
MCQRMYPRVKYSYGHKVEQLLYIAKLPSLRIPFRSLSVDNSISRGASSYVFYINRNIEMEESNKKIETEKAVYRVFIEHLYPNIVQYIIYIPEGIFLRRIESTLQDQLSYDFDTTVKPGVELIVVSEPFYKIDKNFETPPTSPVSEQFSLTSYIYTIPRVKKLIRNKFPSVSVDLVFSDVTTRCWYSEYPSIASVQQDVLSQLGRSIDKDGALMQAVIEEIAIQHPLLRVECEEFIANQARG